MSDSRQTKSGITADRPIRVLLVDDDEFDRRLLRRLFDSSALESFELIEAAVAEEASRLFRDARPDCLLVDYHLPGVNGLSLLESLPSEVDGLPPEAILITVDQDPEIVVAAMRLGIRDFLRKDQCTADSLGQAIWRVVEHRRLRLELVQQREQLRRQNAELLANQRALLNIMDDLEREIALRNQREREVEEQGP